MYKHALKHFKNVDHVLYAASKGHDIDDVRVSNNVFRDIARAISAQQLSGKAADTIFARLEAHMPRDKRQENPGKKQGGKRGEAVMTAEVVMTAEAVHALSESTLRSCGFSHAKVVALRSLARTVMDKKIDLATLHMLDDARVIETLTSVKGIGPWTAEMVLMFSLGREDIFSPGDLGLRKGIMHTYGLKKLPSERKMATLSKAWKPYRTYASRILWRVADAKKVVKSEEGARIS